MRATHLLVPGHVENDAGEHCCLCGCGTSSALKGIDYFGTTFRDYREMQRRLSPYICEMCALSLKDVPGGVVTYADGSQKTPKSDKRGLGWRFFSWILAENTPPIGATRAHCKELRHAMAHPPLAKYFAIGNPEGRGVGRLVWEKEYYGDVLARMGSSLWKREYEI